MVCTLKNYIIQNKSKIVFFSFQANEAFQFVMQRKSTGKVLINARWYIQAISEIWLHTIRLIILIGKSGIDYPFPWNTWNWHSSIPISHTSFNCNLLVLLEMSSGCINLIIFHKDSTEIRSGVKAINQIFPRISHVLSIVLVLLLFLIILFFCLHLQWWVFPNPPLPHSQIVGLFSSTIRSKNIKV